MINEEEKKKVTDLILNELKSIKYGSKSSFDAKDLPITSDFGIHLIANVCKKYADYILNNRQ